MESLLLEGNIFPGWRGLQELPRLITRAPAILQVLEFNSERELDLALAILHLCMGPRMMRVFRERASVRYTAVENLDVKMIAAAKVWMVHDVEEFGAELQQAGLSQKPQL